MTLAAGTDSAAEAGDCRPGAIERLHAAAPEGFGIYQAIKDKKFFLGWISCDEALRGLPTAVHESVHYITAELDAFPLVHGGRLKRPHEVSAFFVPSLIAGKFKANDFVTTYLRRGSASSATDFLYLLDELNAYTHDLNTAVDLSRSRGAVEPGAQLLLGLLDLHGALLGAAGHMDRPAEITEVALELTQDGGNGKR